MLDNATFSLWITDIMLLGLAYWIGRIHASIRLKEFYTANLRELLEEVKALRRKVDRIEIRQHVEK